MPAGAGPPAGSACGRRFQEGVPAAVRALNSPSEFPHSLEALFPWAPHSGLALVRWRRQADKRDGAKAGSTCDFLRYPGVDRKSDESHVPETASSRQTWASLGCVPSSWTFFVERAPPAPWQFRPLPHVLSAHLAVS